MTQRTKKPKEFDTVAFFRDIKERIAKATEGMTLQQRREFFHEIQEGKIKLA